MDLNRREPDSNANSYSAVLSQRTEPCVLVLDNDYVITSADARVGRLFAAAGLSSSANRLPPDLEKAVKNMVCNPETRNAAIAGPLLVRASTLKGVSSFRVVVILELIQIRDSVNGATRRFGLSRRETQVLSLVLDGLEAPDIAQRLQVAESTVSEYFKRLYAKVGANNRNAMLARLFEPEWIS